MATFVVDERQGEVLIPLAALLRRLDFLPVAVWAFRQIELSYPMPFGLSVAAFERLTYELSLGFIVGDEDFQNFLKADFQILDGFIDAYADHSLQHAAYRLSCVDTTQWEVTTTVDSVAEELERRGFKR